MQKAKYFSIDSYLLTKTKPKKAMEKYKVSPIEESYIQNKIPYAQL